MLATKEIIAQTYQPLPLYLAAAGIYWLMSLAFEQVQKRVEKPAGNRPLAMSGIEQDRIWLQVRIRESHGLAQPGQP